MCAEPAELEAIYPQGQSATQAESVSALTVNERLQPSRGLLHPSNVELGARPARAVTAARRGPAVSPWRGSRIKRPCPCGPFLWRGLFSGGALGMTQCIKGPVCISERGGLRATGLDT